MDSDDEIQAMEIPDGFRIQASTPAALDSSLLQRGVLVKAWHEVVWWDDHPTSQERTRHLYDYRVHLEVDQSTRSMKLPLQRYSGDPGAVVGSWVLLERSTVEQVDGGGAAATLGVSRAGRERRPNVTLIDQDG